MQDATRAMIERRDALLGPAYRLFYDEPVHLVRGEGAWLYDADGRRYLDMYNNVPHVGHCHPRVVDAICRQARELNTHTRYLHPSILEYAERLLGKFPNDLDTAMFCCTGSEANELALRIARAATGGEGLIVVSYAYHGNSKATFELSTADIPAADLPEYVVTVPVPDAYRGKYRGDDAGPRYASHVNEAVDELKRRGVRPAAFVVDTIVSCGGVVVPPAGYLREAGRIIRDAGGLFIADEVQPGFGRTGSNFWGFEADNVLPDIVTMGKPMGNGHPLSGVVTTRELAKRFGRTSDYFNTFGGNPVSCAAGLAVLDVIDDEGLQSNALATGNYVAEGLRALADKYACIGDVRGNGLFIALEFVTDRDSREPATELAAGIVNGLRHDGVLTGSIGPDANILKLRPPLVFGKNEADVLLRALDTSISRVDVA